MKIITTRKGKEFYVDDEDYPYLSQFMWHDNGEGYATRNVKAEGGPYRQIRIRMHREILGLAPGDPRQGDHIDGNKANNQRSNLRIATIDQNLRNWGLRSDNKSGFKGVCWQRKCKKWQAYITVNKKRTHLGLFNTPEEAHEAYRKAAVELHGEFANFGDYLKRAA